VKIRSDPASLETRLLYRSGRTTQRKQSFQRRGNDPIHLHTVISIASDDTRGMNGRTRLHVNTFPLLPEQVNPEEKYRDEQADSGSRPDQWGANEVVL